jgi:hypothetical protein
MIPLPRIELEWFSFPWKRRHQGLPLLRFRNQTHAEKYLHVPQELASEDQQNENWTLYHLIKGRTDSLGEPG